MRVCNGVPVLLFLLLATGRAASESALSRGTYQAVLENLERESSTSTCYMEAVKDLKEGCSDSGHLAEDAKQQLAVRLANCRFAADGLPQYTSAAVMAQEAKEGKTVAYNTYTMNFINVEIICLGLSQRFFQRSATRAADHLIAASRQSAEDLVAMADSVDSMKRKTDDMSQRMAENSEKLLQQVDEVHTRIDLFNEEQETRMRSLSNSIEHSQKHIVTLAGQTDNIAHNLHKVEVSARQLSVSQETFGVIIRNVEFVATRVLGSVFSVESFLYFLVALLFSYLTTTTTRTNSCRFPVICLGLANLLVEGALDQTLVDRYDKIWLSRKVFSTVAVALLVVAWWTYRDPQTERMLTINRSVTTVLRKQRRLNKRVKKTERTQAAILQRISDEAANVQTVIKAAASQPSSSRFAFVGGGQTAGLLEDQQPAQGGAGTTFSFAAASGFGSPSNPNTQQQQQQQQQQQPSLFGGAGRLSFGGFFGKQAAAETPRRQPSIEREPPSRHRSASPIPTRESTPELASRPYDPYVVADGAPLRNAEDPPRRASPPAEVKRSTSRPVAAAPREFAVEHTSCRFAVRRHVSWTEWLLGTSVKECVRAASVERPSESPGRSLASDDASDNASDDGEPDRAQSASVPPATTFLPEDDPEDADEVDDEDDGEAEDDDDEDDDEPSCDIVEDGNEDDEDDDDDDEDVLQ
ncbi:hypothetical protein DIPPA_20179 [Diplonema papillatum]|nr:hypothetical protein DIPPA_20179 [Diplonema papillatum]